MNDLRTAAQQALEALNHVNVQDRVEIINNLRAALAEPVQEPVAWKDKIYETLYHQDFGNSIPLYTAPPQRKPLTEEEIREMFFAELRALPSYPSAIEELPERLARAIERAHGIGEQQ